MVEFVRISRQKIAIGTRMEPNGIQEAVHLPIARLRSDMKAPVIWNGQQGTLYFANWWRSAGYNAYATTLFNREGFTIYGPAAVVTKVEKWDCVRSRGSQSAVAQAVQSMNLKSYHIVPTSRRDTHQDVITNDPTTVVALKMLFHV